MFPLQSPLPRGLGVEKNTPPPFFPSRTMGRVHCEWMDSLFAEPISDLQTRIESVAGLPHRGRFRAFLPTLVELGFFHPLTDWQSTLRWARLLVGLGEDRMGFGLGLAGLVEVCLVGNILAEGKRRDLGRAVAEGRRIVSVAISEEGWKGRLKSLGSEVLESEQGFSLTGRKNFATNGEDADDFLILAKNATNRWTDKRYLVVLVSRENPGLSIEPRDLGVAEEATHAVLEFRDLPLDETDVLDLDYLPLAKYLPFWERFCFQFLALGFVRKIGREQRLGSSWDKVCLELEKVLTNRMEEIANNGVQTVRPRDGILGRTQFLQLGEILPDATDHYPEWRIATGFLG